VRIEQALDEAVTLCHSQLKKDEIQVLFDRQNSEFLEVSADPQQIVQVVLNLISNARYSLNEKYPERHPDKSITCSLSKVSMAGSFWVKLAIADRGGGIPQAMLSKVLNPFFTTKPNGRGTGLGLSICNTIIVDHGGLLEISSVEGTSTTVSFLLPAWGGNGA
jgi:signal transduction histidine kinase